MKFLAGSVRQFARLGRDRSGNFAVMAGVFLPVAVVLAAFGVDHGSLYADRRDLQSLSDIAAITAARNLDRATEAAALVVGDNRSGGISISEAGAAYDPTAHATDQIDLIVQKGRYTGKAGTPVNDRFQVGVTPFNAVEVTMRKGGDLYFGKSLMGTPLIETRSIAHIPAEASFSIGSRLASLNGGIVNTVLDKLLGTSLSLSVMDYEALANLDVNALDFLSGLATQLDLTAGTYNDVLDSDVTIGQIATALADVSGSNQTAQLALQALSANAIDAAIPLRHLIDLGTVGRLGIGEKPQGLGVDTNVMDLLRASAGLANASRQVDVGVGLALPGVASVSAKLVVGEPPQHSPYFAVGESGTVVRTAQTRLKVTVGVLGGTMAGQKQDSLLGILLGTLVPVVLNIASIQLPIYVEVAHAEARLLQVSCPTGQPDSLLVTIAAKPGVASAYIGTVPDSQFTNFTSAPVPGWARLTTISLGTVDVLSVEGKASVPIQNIFETNLTFNKVEVDAKTIKNVSTSTPLQSITGALISDLQIRTGGLGSVLGLVLPTVNAVKGAVVGLLTPIAAPVDGLLYGVLGAVGVKIGEADIRVTGATCGRPVLVQ